MHRLNLLHHLWSVLRFVAARLTGRLTFPRDRQGREIWLPDGSRWIIFREVLFRGPRGATPVAPAPGATFLVRFHVARMTVPQNIRFSWLPIPGSGCGTPRRMRHPFRSPL